MRLIFLFCLVIIPFSLKSMDIQDTLRTWDVTINEIMADPDPVAGSIIYPEYVELYNRTTHAIYLKNWKLCAGANCRTLPDVMILPDSFLVLVSATHVNLFPPGINLKGITAFPVLTNPGQLIQLLNEAGNIMHAVSYTDEWYGDPFKKEGGYSLEQLDAFNPCSEIKNWKASIHVDGGTPGRRNSVVVINNDTQPPEILRISVLLPDLIEVIFSEALDSTTLSGITAYTVSNMGAPKSIQLVKPYFKSVVLRLGDTLKKSIMYTLEIRKQISDCAGNKLEYGASARFAIPSDITPNDIVINELLFNPREGGVDFAEIYNRSEKVLDLKTLFLCHYDSTSQMVSDVERITIAPYLLFPGEYLVLTEEAETVKRQYPAQNPRAFLNVENLPVMPADEGDIALKTATELIDHFSYQDKMHFTLLKETRGVSLERVDFMRPTNDVTNWHSASSSVDFATPGYENSQYVDELLTDDAVSIYPEVFSPDEDGVDDLVTIQYRLNEPGHMITVLIYNSEGRLVRTLVNNEFIGTEGRDSWDGINDRREKEKKGIYIFFTRIRDASERIQVYKKLCVLSGKS